MKINVVHKDGRFLINVLDTHMIWEVKEMVSKALNLNLNFRHNEKEERKNYEQKNDDLNYEEKDNKGNFLLYYNGSTLNDNCTVSEIGLVSGSTVRCRHIQRSPYNLKIRIICLSKEIELRDEISIETTTIGELRTIMQNRIGIPVSIFNLQQTTQKRDLFDNRLLPYYGIRQGDTIVLDVWKGTRELIVAALNDDISQTLSNVPNYHDNPILNRYYLKVALFIAAHFDFVNLAAQVLQRGVRCDEPVSEHPSRQWCLQQSHPDVFKTPVHQAAQRGSFRLINIFLRHSPACIVAKDGHGRSPSIYASQNGHMECWKLLMVAQFQFQSICGFSLVTYAKIMKWCNKARDRILYFKAENKKQLLLHSQLYPTDTTCLGDPIIISGFHDCMAGESERKRLNKLSIWSYNMHKNEANKRRPSSKLQQKSTTVIDKPQKLSSAVGIPHNPLPSVHSYYANALKRELTSRSKSTKDRSNTASDISSKSDNCSLAKFKNRLALRRTNKQNAHDEAGRIIYKTTGKTPAQIANKCFEMGQTFDKMKWRSQMNIALKCSLNCIESNKNAT